MNTKKYIISASIVTAILVGVSSLAFAENNGVMQGDNSMHISDMRGDGGQIPVLQVGPKGEVLMRGTISVASASSLTVKSWGGEWIINISTATQLMPQTAMSQFQAGDFVGVQGVVSQTALWTIDARIVRDWTAKKMLQENRQMLKTERHNNEQEIRDVIKNESPANHQGIATNINAGAKSFTLSIDGIAYTVNLVIDATVVDKTFLSTDLTKIKEGDTVRVWGPTSGTIISAYVFRDVSLMTSLSQ